MQDYKNLTEPQLTELLKASDHAAFTEIYNRYHGLLIDFAYRKLKDEELAKDFVQELFTALWQKSDMLQESGKLSSYMFISLRSKIINYFVHQKVEVKYIDSLKSFVAERSVSDTDYKIRSEQLADSIDQHIQDLPAKMRTIFEMSRKEHLSYKQISERLSISERTIQAQISNSLNRLKAKLLCWLF